MKRRPVPVRATVPPGRGSDESRRLIPGLGPRRLLWQLAAAILISAAVLVAGELGLRLLGYGYPTTFFIPVKGEEVLTTNPRFGWRFQPRDQSTQPYPVILPATKPANTRRVFVVGDSAAQGTPAPAFGFARMLEYMLRQQYPRENFELINAAMRGINSHVAQYIARDCAAQQPDLVIVYLGNNEATGLYSPEPDRVSLAAHPILLRASEWLRAMKGTQLLASLLYRAHRSERRVAAQDMEFFRSKRMSADDPRRDPVYANFRANLQRICAAAQAGGAKVVLSTVAVNLGDCPPLGSLHRPGLTAAELSSWRDAYAQGTNAEAQRFIAMALTNYLAAARLDDHFAELHYRLGRCWLGLGKADEAVWHFALARDWDALPLRADGRLNQLIRETAIGSRDGRTVLVDAERAFAEASYDEHGVPGSRWFYEHVHFRFAGDYLMACTMFPAVRAALGLAASNTPLPTSRECAEGLAYTPWDDLGVRSAMAQLTAKPPFLDQVDHRERQAEAERMLAEESQSLQRQDGLGRSLRLYRDAVARQPRDWPIRANFAAFLDAVGNKSEAATAYSETIRLMPVFAALRVQYAQVLVALGRHREAVSELESALRLQPEFGPAREGLRRLSR